MLNRMRCGLVIAGLGFLCGLLASTSALAADSAASPPTTFAGQPIRPDDGKLGIIQFGAHPDDCEIRAGGVAALWAAQGNHVKFVSMTNGDVGHWKMSGGALARRRNAEVQRAAKILGVTTQVLDNHDGELMPTLENRKTVTRLIRQWNADIVIGHRPNDYHPDHRYTGVLMQDAAYMTGVPNLCPDTPALKKSPLFLYSYDRFQRPNPFRPDIVVSLDSVIEKKVAALAEIESQFIEGGCDGGPERVPHNAAEKEAAVKQVKARFKTRFANIADRCRDQLVKLYGPELGHKVRYAEAFEICEYGRQPSKAELRRLFPFFPAGE